MEYMVKQELQYSEQERFNRNYIMQDQRHAKS